MATTFTPQQQLPDILKSHPQVRVVLDRYGLKGCGGKHGPAESVEFFARSHGVEQGRLLAELEEAARGPAPAAAPARANFADAAYRPFFIAGMAVFVLIGVVTGTTMLAWMSGDQSFFAPGIHRMNAHANAMVYGFAGMFVMGFGYQALPRFRHTQLWRPRLALTSFVLLLGGVVLRFSGEFFGQQGIYQPALVPAGFAAGIAGNVLELAAFSLFALIMWKTLRVDGRLRVYERYVIASAAWFIVSVAFCLVLFILTHRASDFGVLVATVAMLQESLRTVQMFGAIGLVVLGVMLRFLPTVFAFRDPGEKLFARMFWVINGGILLAALAFPFSMAAKRDVTAGDMLTISRSAYALGMLLVVGGYLTLVASFASWRKARVQDRSVKFIRAAHAWLVISLLMIVFEPIYIGVVQGTFGHGYHAGMRHAYTIGFMTMMVVAVSIKVVPNLNGVNPARLGRLWPVFALLNLSLVWRVIGEIAGDFDPALLAGIHWSGVAAGIALLLWATHLLRVMFLPPTEAPQRVDEITSQTRVAAVLDTWPQTLPVFLRHGFTLLLNPVARRTIARSVSLAHVCSMNDKDVDSLVAELRAAAGLGHECSCSAGVTADQHVCGSPQAINADASVAETAREHPATVAVFTRLGLDTCCGGAESIRNAAAHNSKPLEDVLHQLELAIREEHHDKAGATCA
ncbi:MAG: DUF542 domain-containing protein [Planctomycetes bacterium]|nr:DUF542 domain-containing protein [Planctomycetota bacterium]